MTTAYGNDEGDGRGFRATQRGDSARRFRAARRHSRRVRILRVAIPLAVFVGVAFIALSTWFNPLRMLSRLPLSIGDVVVSGTKIKMENPKLSGFTKDAHRYDLTAGAAAQDLTRPGIIELQEINAAVEMENDGLMKLTAASGLFDTKSEILTLQRNIVVTSSKGEKGLLEEAVVDTRNGNMVSEKPVTLYTADSVVKANRLEILQGGGLIRFGKGVVVNMRATTAAAPNGNVAETP
jgi:lipopolysaccharide export system protein LptC